MKSKKILLCALLTSYVNNVHCMEEENQNDQLILAIIHENLEKVDKELKNRNPNYLAGKFSPLEFACSSGNVEIIEKLVVAGADVNYQEFDEECWPRNMTALTQAAIHGHLEICKELIKLGANVNPLNPDNFTPLHAAACRGDVEMVKLLIKYKANLDAQTEYEGNTALHEAIPTEENLSSTKKTKNSKFDVCRLLLDAGANPNLRNKHYTPGQKPFTVPDKTPLMLAAQRKNHLFVAMLLCYNANARIPDRHHKYPLEYPEIAKYYSN